MIKKNQSIEELEAPVKESATDNEGKVDNVEQPQAEKGFFGKHHTACISAVAAVAGFTLAAVISLGVVACSQTAETIPTEGSSRAAATETAEPVHTHDWTMTYKTIHHDAVTHTETVEPVYANKTSYHTVCNDCEQVIDGIADQHIKDTGHSGYSTNVPIVNEVLVSEGYTYEVTDTPAYDETVADEMVCTVCGAEQAITAQTE